MKERRSSLDFQALLKNVGDISHTPAAVPYSHCSTGALLTKHRASFELTLLGFGTKNTGRGTICLVDLQHKRMMVGSAKHQESIFQMCEIMALLFSLCLGSVMIEIPTGFVEPQQPRSWWTRLNFSLLYISPRYATVEEILDCFATFVANKNIKVSCMLHAWIKTALCSGEICHVLVPIHSPISIPYFWGSTGPTVLDMDSKKNKFSWHNPSVSPWSNWKRKSKCLGSHTEMTKSSCHTWLELEWDYIILIEVGLILTPLKNDLDGTGGKKIKEPPSCFCHRQTGTKNGCFPWIFIPMTGRQKKTISSWSKHPLLETNPPWVWWFHG